MTNTTNTVEQNNTKLDDEALDAVQGARGVICSPPQPPGFVTVEASGSGGSSGGHSWSTFRGSATLSDGTVIKL